MIRVREKVRLSVGFRIKVSVTARALVRVYESHDHGHRVSNMLRVKSNVMVRVGSS